MKIKPLRLVPRLKRYSWLRWLAAAAGQRCYRHRPDACESRAQPVDGVVTLVFLRHGEKPAGGLQLNCQGLNCAMNLATLLPEKLVQSQLCVRCQPDAQRRGRRTR